jgi:hypothetical protein
MACPAATLFSEVCLEIPNRPSVRSPGGLSGRFEGRSPGPASGPRLARPTGGTPRQLHPGAPTTIPTAALGPNPVVLFRRRRVRGSRLAPSPLGASGERQGDHEGGERTPPLHQFLPTCQVPASRSRALGASCNPIERTSPELRAGPTPERCVEPYYQETGVGRDDYPFRLHSAIACERRPFDIAD